MYAFTSRITKNKVIGTLSAALYMIMPYHLTDMYIRNAIGEFLSYIFVPLVFLGLYKIFQKEKGEWILCIGAVRFNIYAYINDIFNSYHGIYIYLYLYNKIKR